MLTAHVAAARMLDQLQACAAADSGVAVEHCTFQPGPASHADREARVHA